MLLDLLTELRNYFAHSEYEEEFELDNDTLTVADGTEFKVGQFVFIISDLNRILCQIDKIEGNILSLTSEQPIQSDKTTFVALLNIPVQVRKLAQDIQAWEDKKGDGIYASESFGGWSGTLATGKNGVITWQEAFAKKLKPWKRMFADISKVV